MAYFKTSFRVAWADTDAAGIVHFSNYLRYFERAEEEMYRELGLTFNLITFKFGILLPRLESRLKFLSPCKQGDEIETEICFSQIRKRSFEEEFKIMNLSTAKLAVEGTVVTVATPVSIEKSTELPDGFVSEIQRFSKPSADAERRL